MSDVAERVKKIVVEHLGVDDEKVTPEASFIDDLGADSLDTVELVMAFEEEFGIEIPDDAAERSRPSSDAIEFIEKHQAEAACFGVSCLTGDQRPSSKECRPMREWSSPGWVSSLRWRRGVEETLAAAD